jgi:hypothetical protein
MAIKASRVDVDASVLMGHLHDYALVLGKELGEVVRDQAGFFCMDLAKHTFPQPKGGMDKGLSSDAKKMGLENVSKSINKIFKPLDQASKKEVAAIDRYDVFKWWSKGDDQPTVGRKQRWTVFKSMNAGGRAIPFIDKGDLSSMESIHTKLRKNKGHGGLVDYAKKAKNAFGIVRDQKTIDKFVKQKQKGVGSLKSAYWFAADKISAKKVTAPAWVKHSSGSQYAIGIDNIMKAMMPEATVGNTIGLLSTPRGIVNRAVKDRAYAMRNAIAYELNKQKVTLWQACAKGQTTHTSKYF